MRPEAFDVGQTRPRRVVERIEMAALGYTKHETDCRILRGDRVGDVIVDAKISTDGLYVYTLIGPRNREVA